MEIQVESYRTQYLEELAACRECYRSGDFQGWGGHGKTFLDRMCFCLVYFLAEDEQMAVDILEGRRDFKHQYEEQAKMPPFGPRLIGLIYQGNGNRLGDVDFHRLCNAYTRIRKIGKGVPVSESEADEINRILEKAAEAAGRVLEAGKPSKTLPKLEVVLEQCNQVAKEGHADAKQYLSVIKNALQEADSIIGTCKTSIDDLHISDSLTGKEPSFQDIVKEQLETLRRDFWQTFNDCSNDLREKANETNRFNVTVFGVTQAGKSTLMSILTKGHEDAIGKGGQRTTRDVRSYDWNGLTIIDVPGIGAVQGQEDSQLADAAAVYADLILFLLSSDSPTDEEAEWLVHLKRKDKPILCIINFHESIADEMDLDIFLQNPGYYIRSSKMEEVKKQFLEFVHKRLPDEHLDIQVSHFLARKMADNPAYRDYREQLLKASHFEVVERSIIRTVINNGVLYRKKCFLSIIDNPLYKQMDGMITFYRQTKGLHDLAFQKKQEFETWKENFVTGLDSKTNDLVKGCFDPVKAEMKAFVDDHIKDRDFNRQLNKFLAEKKIGEKVKKKRDEIIQKAHKDVEAFFTDLAKEGKFTMKWAHLSEGGVRIHDWQRIVKWSGIVLEVVSAVFTGGWTLILVPITFVLDRIARKMRTKDEKIAEYKKKTLASINRNMDKQRDKITGQVQADLIKNLENGLFKDAGRRFYIMKISIEAMLEGQRHLVRRYNQCHREVNRKLVANILDSMGYKPEDYASLQVARIPGKWTMLVPGDETIWKRHGEKEASHSLCQNISAQLGNQEKVSVLWLNTSLPRVSQARFLLRYLFGQADCFFSLNDEYDYMYVDRSLTVDFNRDQIDLLQQLLSVMILPNDKYYGKD